ncbi:conserved hypothetical protein [Paraburkholderia tropica]
MSRELDEVFDGVWDAFTDAGFFEQATILPATGEPFDITVDFRKGSAELFNGAAQTSQFSITYRIADATLKRASLLSIDSVTYRLKADPEPDETGLNATAELELKR